MKRILSVTVAALLSFVLLALGSLSLVGISPSYLVSAPAVATGIGSKLLCSSLYVSKFSKAQSFDDLVQYSSILNELTLTYDESQRKVGAALLGLGSKSATYLPGIGCAVDYAGYPVRETLSSFVVPPTNADQPWPLGDVVTTTTDQVQDAIDAMIANDNRQGFNTRALLAVKDGRIVGEAYAQGATAQTPLLGWSMAKSVTAVMLANLEHRELLALDAPPGFAEWAGDERAQIRTTDLLTMTDGLDFSEEYNPGDDATAMLFDAPSAADYVLAKPAVKPPGEHFNYSSGTANVLARVYQDALGGPAAARADYEANIASALGFQNAVFETDAAGGFVGSSYLYASARDWARLGQLMLNDGEINGRRVMNPGWVARATTQNGSANHPAYGYQWWLNEGNRALAWADLPRDSYAAMGNRKQVVMVVPSEQTVIVRLGWTAGAYPDNDNFAELLRVIRASSGQVRE